MRARATVGAFILTLSMAASAALAQPAGRFLAGLDLLSSHIGAEDPNEGSPAGAVYVDEVGSGGALLFGYSLTPAFQLRLYFSGAVHQTTDADLEVRLLGGTIEAAYLFRAGQPLRPYLCGGLGGFTLKSEQDALRYETSGPGAVLGAGLHYFLGGHVALHFSMRGEWINWEKTKAEIVLPGGDVIAIETPVDESGFAGKFSAGVGFWF